MGPFAAGFAYGGGKGKDGIALWDSLYGITLLLISVMADAFLPNLQQKVMAKVCIISNGCYSVTLQKPHARISRSKDSEPTYGCFPNSTDSRGSTILTGCNTGTAYDEDKFHRGSNTSRGYGSYWTFVRLR
eukprot:391200-Pyramimonas_sp.AAC.2